MDDKKYQMPEDRGHKTIDKIPEDLRPASTREVYPLGQPGAAMREAHNYFFSTLKGMGLITFDYETYTRKHMGQPKGGKDDDDK
ncbi:MAG: hypothetical protein AABW51_01715 [Nanoarchaeota archaeon]